MNTETKLPPYAADDIRAHRSATAERTKQDRIRVAGEALRRAGFGGEAAMVETCSPTSPKWCDLDATVVYARREVAALISRLADGSDEPRYAAAMSARRALGALWEVL